MPSRYFQRRISRCRNSPNSSRHFRSGGSVGSIAHGENGSLSRAADNIPHCDRPAAAFKRPPIRARTTNTRSASQVGFRFSSDRCGETLPEHPASEVLERTMRLRFLPPGSQRRRSPTPSSRAMFATFDLNVSGLKAVKSSKSKRQLRSVIFSGGRRQHMQLNEA